MVRVKPIYLWLPGPYGFQVLPQQQCSGLGSIMAHNRVRVRVRVRVRGLPYGLGSS